MFLLFPNRRLLSLERRG